MGHTFDGGWIRCNAFVAWFWVEKTLSEAKLVQYFLKIFETHATELNPAQPNIIIIMEKKKKTDGGVIAMKCI
jgi:hypothetical protein